MHWLVIALLAVIAAQYFLCRAQKQFFDWTTTKIQTLEWKLAMQSVALNTAKQKIVSLKARAVKESNRRLRNSQRIRKNERRINQLAIFGGWNLK